MAKRKYVLLGPETGSSGFTVVKELVTFEGDALRLEDGFVLVRDNEAQDFNAAVVRLAEGQAIKQV